MHGKKTKGEVKDNKEGSMIMSIIKKNRDNISIYKIPRNQKIITVKSIIWNVFIEYKDVDPKFLKNSK